MKSTFSVIYYLKRQVVKKDGTVPVMGRITVDGSQTQFSCKLSVDPKLWDTKGGRVTVPKSFNLLIPISTSCLTKSSPIVPLDKLTMAICFIIIFSSTNIIFPVQKTVLSLDKPIFLILFPISFCKVYDFQNTDGMF